MVDRIELYNKLSPELQARFNGSDPACALLPQLIAEFRLSPDQAREFIIQIGDVLLGIDPVDQLPKFLQTKIGITESVALQIVSKVTDFLSPAIHTVKQVTGKESSDVTASAPAAVIDPMRTMEEDVDRIHGYGAYRELYPDAPSDDEPVHRSSQDDMLRRTPLAEPPKYQLDEPSGN